MNLLQLKNKYRNILAYESSSEDSDGEWKLYMKGRASIKQTAMNKSISIHSRTTHEDVDELLAVKEKLAQCVATIGRKDKQIQDLKQKLVQNEQQQRVQLLKQDQLSQTLHSTTQQLITSQSELKHLHQTLHQNLQTIDLQKFDNELLNRQSNYYKEEIAGLKAELDGKENRIREMGLRVGEMGKVREEMGRLQGDLGRLRGLLRESQKYRKFASKLEYHHYIAKGTNEWQNWVPATLPDDVSQMLKKLGLAKADKKIQENICKYINKYAHELAKAQSKKVRKQYNNRLKTLQRKQSPSPFFPNLSTSTASQPRKPNRKPRSITQASHNSHQSAPHCPPSLDTRQICTRILKELRSKILSELEQKELSKRRISIILDWCIDSVVEVLGREDGEGQDKSVNIGKTFNTTNIF